MPITIETQNTEFKESWRDECLKTISAFANTDGGLLLIGVNDKGETLGGLNIKKLLVDIPNTINNKLSIFPSVKTGKHNANEYIKVVIEKSTVPISYNGKYYIRSGSTTQELNGTLLIDFLQSKTGRTWDEVHSIDFRVDDIDEMSVLKFRNRAEERIPSIAHENDVRQILERLYLIQDSKIKNAGILLFFKDPQNFFMQSNIKIGKFIDEANLETQDMIEGNLFKQAVNSIEVLDNKYLKRTVKFEKGSIERKDILEYPLEALREAIFNAIIHKDYAIKSDIQIRIFDDKLMIVNIGSLPAEVPITKLKSSHISKPRNPLIANVFQKAGYIEAWGRGTNKIVQACKEAGLPEPEFTEVNGVFTVMLYKDKLSEDYLKKSGLSERQINAVLHIKEEGKITNKEYRNLNGVSDETARNELKDLINKGFLETKGRGRSIFYILVNNGKNNN
jgi:ATP-dependent DNA helicase RecG